MRISKILFACLSLISISGYGQTSDSIQVSYLSKVMVVFTEPIVGNPVIGSMLANVEKRDDFTLIIEGNAEIIQKLNGRVPPTNLLVKTTNSYYNFYVEYNKYPSRHIVTPDGYKAIYTSDTPQKNESVVGTTKTPMETGVRNEPVKTPLVSGGFGKVPVDRLMKLDSSKSDLIFGGMYSGSRLFFTVSNMWVDSDYLYVRVSIENKASSPYDIDYFRFVLSDGKWGTNKKNTPRLEEKDVFDRLNEVRIQIEAGSTYTNVFVFEKFTLYKGQYFNVQVGEVDGGRKATINMSRSDMFRTKNIN